MTESNRKNPPAAPGTEREGPELDWTSPDVGRAGAAQNPVRPPAKDEDNDWQRGGKRYGTEGIHGPGASGKDAPVPQNPDSATRTPARRRTDPPTPTETTPVPKDGPVDKHSSAGS